MAEITAKLKLPIVLIHGLGARAGLGPFDYFFGIAPRLRAAGNDVFVARVPFWNSIEKRAEILGNQLRTNFAPGKKVNLIGHSLGGIDARYVTSALGFSEMVASVTTIGTANRGTTLSDLALGLVPNSTHALLDQIIKPLKASNLGLRQTTREFCEGMLAAHAPNIPSVAYFSASTVITGNAFKTALPVFWASHQILKFYEGENDGLVPLQSAKWGEHICTFEGDHYAQIGQPLGLKRGMDHIAFHDEIFRRLEREGF